jgi:uncharacterized protein YbgA (DUF1722 family)/uncharacterized protein YbbK (DUF523 family)
MEDTVVKIGVSSCLLGNNVRYDGANARDSYIVDIMGQFVDFYPVCPEVESGLPVPREPMRLEGDPEAPELITVETRVHQTDRMGRWSSAKLDDLEKKDLWAFVFKSRSPSSGMRKVKVYDEKGIPVRVGVGLFARAFMDRFPFIPVEDEETLRDPVVRENFIERVFALKRWRDVRSEEPTAATLVDFHTRHKLQILSHSPKHYSAMGKLVADLSERPIDGVYSDYELKLMQTLKLTATPEKSYNVLQHAVGYFKKRFSGAEKQAMLEAIETYAENRLPLIVPITLLAHYAAKYDEPYLKRQTYLNPDPVELMLRNHA